MLASPEPDAGAGPPPGLDASLLEATPAGQVPRVAPDGRSPLAPLPPAVLGRGLQPPLRRGAGHRAGPRRQARRRAPSPCPGRSACPSRPTPAPRLGRRAPARPGTRPCSSCRSSRSASRSTMTGRWRSGRRRRPGTGGGDAAPRARRRRRLRRGRRGGRRVRGRARGLRARGGGACARAGWALIELGGDALREPARAVGLPYLASRDAGRRRPVAGTRSTGPWPRSRPRRARPGGPWRWRSRCRRASTGSRAWLATLPAQGCGWSRRAACCWTAVRGRRAARRGAAH